MTKTKWKLVSKETGEEVELGAKLISFRNEEYKYIGGNPPHKPSSSGSVFVEKGDSGWSYYPNVFGLKWEERDE